MPDTFRQLFKIRSYNVYLSRILALLCFIGSPSIKSFAAELRGYLKNGDGTDPGGVKIPPDITDNELVEDFFAFSVSTMRLFIFEFFARYRENITTHFAKPNEPRRWEIIRDYRNSRYITRDKAVQLKVIMPGEGHDAKNV